MLTVEILSNGSVRISGTKQNLQDFAHWLFIASVNGQANAKLDPEAIPTTYLHIERTS